MGRFTDDIVPVRRSMARTMANAAASPNAPNSHLMARGDQGNDSVSDTALVAG